MEKIGAAIAKEEARTVLGKTHGYVFYRLIRPAASN
jgi:hypothetical protein